MRAVNWIAAYNRLFAPNRLTVPLAAGGPLDLIGQVFVWLASEAFLERMERRAEGKPVANVARRQRRPACPSAEGVTAAVLSGYRIKDEKTLRSRAHQEAFQGWVYLLRRAVNLPLQEVAKRGKVSPSRISKIQRAIETGKVPATLRQLLHKCKVKN